MTAPSTLGRATVWLILAADGPGRGIGSHLLANGSAIGAAAVHVVDEPALFLDALTDQRPRIALAAWPPADDAILDELARERRRRHGLRVVALLAARLALLADRARRATAPTLLAAHPGRAFTRQQLLDRVWGPGHVGDPRTVDVHVRWLRAKVERDPERPAHLVTVRGVGYRLDPPDR
jgi:DNA-binding winged helix-turn-helix (wHTH) protein